MDGWVSFIKMQFMEDQEELQKEENEQVCCIYFTKHTHMSSKVDKTLHRVKQIMSHKCLKNLEVISCNLCLETVDEQS